MANSGAGMIPGGCDTFCDVVNVPRDVLQRLLAMLDAGELDDARELLRFTLMQEKDWPEFGELDGAPVRLDEVDAMPEQDRVRVVVDVPGIGKVRPWRFAGGPEDAAAVRFHGPSKRHGEP